MKKVFVFNRDTLAYENVKPNTYVKIGTYVVGCFIVLFTLGWMSGTNNYVVKYFTNEVTDTLTIHGTPFSEDGLIELLKNCHIKYPHVVFAQAKLESSNFSSRIFRQNHNMFGMRKARQRITAAQSEKDTYAYYRDWIDCVYDYAMYQGSVMCNINNEAEYFAKLGERYAEDSLYVPKLKQIIKKENLKSVFEE